MHTFTAIALDSLIEPGAEKSMVLTRNSPDPRLERRRSTSSTSNYTESRGLDDTNLKLERGPSIPPISKLKLEKGGYLPPNGRLERGVSVPPSTNNVRGVSIPPNGKLEKGVSVPSHVKLANDAPIATATTAVADNKNHWTQISPALYTTPESTPLPGSPSSFPPSPYIINHKRRGPRLMKSFSEEDVVTWKKESDEIKVDENEKTAETCSVSKNDIYIPSEVLDSTLDDTIKPFGSGDSTEKHMIGACSDVHGSRDVENGPAGQNGVERFVDFSFQPNVEVDDFIGQQNSTNVKNIGDNEENSGAEQSCNLTTPMAEFYDAWEGAFLTSLM